MDKRDEYFTRYSVMNSDLDHAVEVLRDIENDNRDEDEPEYTAEQIAKGLDAIIEEVLRDIMRYPDEWAFSHYEQDYTRDYEHAVKNSRRSNVTAKF